MLGALAGDLQAQVGQLHDAGPGGHHRRVRHRLLPFPVPPPGDAHLFRAGVQVVEPGDGENGVGAGGQGGRAAVCSLLQPVDPAGLGHAPIRRQGQPRHGDVRQQGFQGRQARSLPRLHHPEPGLLGPPLPPGGLEIPLPISWLGPQSLHGGEKVRAPALVHAGHQVDDRVGIVGLPLQQLAQLCQALPRLQGRRGRLPPGSPVGGRISGGIAAAALGDGPHLPRGQGRRTPGLVFRQQGRLDGPIGQAPGPHGGPQAE